MALFYCLVELCLSARDNLLNMILITSKFLLLIFIISFSLNSYGQSFSIGKMRGEATFSDGINTIALKSAMKLHGPGIVTTKKSSFVRIKIEEQGTLTVGANSRMSIKKEGKRTPALISLLRGKIRAKINKTKTGKHKLLLQTRSASIGVRGTDFLLVYNEKNHITSNITFSGEVDFYKKSDERILESLKEDFDNGNDLALLKSMNTTSVADELSTNKIVRIRKGDFSGAYPTYETPLAPTKISNLQLQILAKEFDVKDIRSRSGVVYNKVLRRKKFKLTNKNLIPEPQGRKVEELLTYEDKIIVSGLSVRPGGVIDLDTGIYVMPPKGSHYDKSTSTYLMPSDYGGVDSGTGDYVPPKNIEIDPLKGFVRWENGVRKQIDKFSKAVTDLFDKYKNMTRVDFLTDLNYFYSLKSYENYYGEYKHITNANSMTFDAGATAGRHIFNNKRYLHYLKARIDMVLYNRRDEPLVQRNDRLITAYGYEFHRKHIVNKRKTRFVVDAEFETTYQDHRNRDQFDFYTERSRLKIYEEFNLSRRHINQIGMAVSAFQGHTDDNHGNIIEGFWNNSISTNRPYSFELNFLYSSRIEKKNDNHFNISKAEFVVTRKDIFRKTNLSLFSAYEYHDSQKEVDIDHAKVFDSKLELLRSKGEYLKFKLYYRYLNHNSTGLKNRDFIQQEWGIGSQFIF